MTRRRSRRGRTRTRYYYLVVGGVAVALVLGYLLLLVSGTLSPGGAATPTATQRTTTGSKSVILYVNQGNGAVNESNFPKLLETTASHGFNTIFFQVYRSGTLLFANSSLSYFVSAAHGRGLQIFFALYLTNSTQSIPASIYPLGEDGVNLDMSALSLGAQKTLLDELSSGYSGRTAITSTDPTLPLNPGLLIIETYGAGNEQYIHHGIIASVGVFATSNRQDYLRQFQYAMENSDGVMVFDYAGLLKAGY